MLVKFRSESRKTVIRMRVRDAVVRGETAFAPFIDRKNLFTG